MKETYALFLVFISFFLLHLYLSIGVNTPLMYPDEAGYIEKARFLLYGSHFQTAYYPGYSLILVPIFYLSNDITISYKLIQVLNSIIMSFIPLVSYLLLGLINVNLSKRLRLLLSIVVTVYPPFLVYSNTALVGGLFILGFLLLSLQIALFSFTPQKKILLVTIPVSYISLSLIHPRALAILPALIIVLALNILYTKRYKDILPLFVSFLVSYLLRSYILYGVYDFGSINSSYSDATSTSINLLAKNFLTGPSGFINLLLTLVGQLFYLILSTYGIVLLGIIYAIRVICDFNLRITTKQEYMITLFLLLSFVGVSLLSAISLSGGERADHLIYGRYTEGVLAPILLLGLLFHMTKQLNNRELIALVILTSLLFTILYSTKLNLLENADAYPMNIVGVGYYLIFGYFNFIGVTTIFLVVSSLLFLTGRVNKKYALLLLSLIFLTTAIYTNAEYFIKGSEYRASQRELVKPLQKLIDDKKLDVLDLSFDEETCNSWFSYNYQTYIPSLRMDFFNSSSNQTSSSDLIITCRPDFRVLYPGWVVVGIENNDQYLLAAPGEIQDFFLGIGYVLSENFTSPLPKESYSSNIQIDFNDTILFNTRDSPQIHVSVTNTGIHSMWPSTDSINSWEYSVNLGLLAYENSNKTDFIYTCRTKLPYPLYPQEKVDLKLPVVCLPDDKRLPNGEYLLKVSMVQESVTWFSDAGDNSLILVLNVTGDKLTISNP